MKANAPDKIYACFGVFGLIQATEIRATSKDIEYARTDALIEKATQFLYDYNQKQVLKHGARATLGCGEYTINVDEFRKYMEGE